MPLGHALSCCRHALAYRRASVACLSVSARTRPLLVPNPPRQPTSKSRLSCRRLLSISCPVLDSAGDDSEPLKRTAFYVGEREASDATRAEDGQRCLDAQRSNSPSLFLPEDKTQSTPFTTTSRMPVSAPTLGKPRSTRASPPAPALTRTSAASLSRQETHESSDIWYDKPLPSGGFEVPWNDAGEEAQRPSQGSDSLKPTPWVYRSYPHRPRRSPAADPTPRVIRMLMTEKEKTIEGWSTMSEEEQSGALEERNNLAKARWHALSHSERMRIVKEMNVKRSLKERGQNHARTVAGWRTRMWEKWTVTGVRHPESQRLFDASLFPLKEEDDDASLGISDNQFARIGARPPTEDCIGRLTGLGTNSTKKSLSLAPAPASLKPKTEATRAKQGKKTWPLLMSRGGPTEPITSLPLPLVPAKRTKFPSKLEASSSPFCFQQVPLHSPSLATPSTLPSSVSQTEEAEKSRRRQFPSPRPPPAAPLVASSVSAPSTFSTGAENQDAPHPKQRLAQPLVNPRTVALSQIQAISRRKPPLPRPRTEAAAKLDLASPVLSSSSSSALVTHTVTLSSPFPASPFSRRASSPSISPPPQRSAPSPSEGSAQPSSSYSPSASSSSSSSHFTSSTTTFRPTPSSAIAANTKERFRFDECHQPLPDPSERASVRRTRALLRAGKATGCSLEAKPRSLEQSSQSPSASQEGEGGRTTAVSSAQQQQDTSDLSGLSRLSRNPRAMFTEVLKSFAQSPTSKSKVSFERQIFVTPSSPSSSCSAFDSVDVDTGADKASEEPWAPPKPAHLVPRKSKLGPKEEDKKRQDRGGSLPPAREYQEEAAQFAFLTPEQKAEKRAQGHARRCTPMSDQERTRE